MSGWVGRMPKFRSSASLEPSFETMEPCRPYPCAPASGRGCVPPRPAPPHPASPSATAEEVQYPTVNQSAVTSRASRLPLRHPEGWPISITRCTATAAFAAQKQPACCKKQYSWRRLYCSPCRSAGKVAIVTYPSALQFPALALARGSGYLGCSRVKRWLGVLDRPHSNGTPARRCPHTYTHTHKHRSVCSRRGAAPLSLLVGLWFA